VRSGMDAERSPGGASPQQADAVRSRLWSFEAALRARSRRQVTAWLNSPGRPTVLRRGLPGCQLSVAEAIPRRWPEQLQPARRRSRRHDSGVVRQARRRLPASATRWTAAAPALILPETGEESVLIGCLLRGPGLPKYAPHRRSW